MKIVLIVSSYAPHIGGLQTAVRELAHALQARGDDVTVITQRHPRSLAGNEIVDGIRVRRAFFMMPRWADVQRGRIDLVLGGVVFFPLTCIWLVLYLWRNDGAVVNLHFVGAPALFVALAQQMLGFRLIVSLHGNDVAGLAEQGGFQRWVFEYTLARATVVTAPSRALADRAAALIPAVRERLAIVPNGVKECEGKSNASRPSWLPGAEFLLAVSRLERVKGMDVLVEAVAVARERGMRVPLVIIGDGMEAAALRQLAKKRAPSQIHFVGAQSHGAALEAMRMARLVIVPSRNESFGLTALEALACGKAVIASQVGGLPDIVREGETGWLVPPENATALADAIISALNQPGLCSEYGERGQAMARSEYSWTAIAARYSQLYAESTDAARD